MLAHCGEIQEDDGVDPRDYFKPARARDKQHRKARQLCQQVAQTLEQVLAGETTDDLLRGLRVASVTPTPDTSRLLVMLHVDFPQDNFDNVVIEQRLARRQGYLRAAVAAAITRRKTPTLVYQVVGPVDVVMPGPQEDCT
jgi:ribosome-binding factor A